MRTFETSQGKNFSLHARLYQVTNPFPHDASAIVISVTMINDATCQPLTNEANQVHPQQQEEISFM